MGQPLISGQKVVNWVDLTEFMAKLNFGSAVLTSVQTRECTVARNSAGNYTVTLPRAYRLLADFKLSFMIVTGAVLFPVVVSSTITTAGKFIFEIRTEAGTATDPADGSVGFLTVAVSNNPFNDATV
jgi:hypothetical protein